MPASSLPPAEKLPTARLLSHVIEASAHAEALGAAPAVSVQVLTAVGIALLDAGQLNTTRPLFDRALAIAQSQLGTDHPGTLTARSNLARWLAEAGQVEDAVSALKPLLEDMLRVMGPDHPDTLATRKDMTYWESEWGQEEFASEDPPVSTWDELDDWWDRNEESESEKEYERAEKAEEAVSEFRRLLEDMLRTLGPDHPNTLITRKEIAHWLAESGQVEEAVSALELLLEDILRVLGPDHPHTLATREDLSRHQSL